MHARQARGRLVETAQEQLSEEALTKLEAAGKYEAVWNQVVQSLNGSGLLTTELQPATRADEQRALSSATVDLLHGSSGSYEQRFDRWVSTFETVFDQAPSWETATALPALTTPLEHIPVDPPSFRKQLKALSRYSSFGARPVGSVYTRCLTMSQALANMLAERGEVPRDLLDVHDFIRVTQSAPSKAQAAAAPRKSRAASDHEDSDRDSSDE
jgi:hypothetical protein